MLQNYYFNRLQSREVDAYYMLDDAVQSYRPECRLYGVNQEQAIRIINTYVAENPNIWHFCSQFVQMQPESEGVLCRLQYYEGDSALFSRRLGELTEKLDAKITSRTSDYEVVKMVYDLLATTVQGDMEAQNTFLQAPLQDQTQIQEYLQKYGSSFTAYGAIVEKKAVCMGVSAACKLLLDRYRVECACAVGTDYGQAHQMNVVEINGVRAYLDVSKGLVRKQLPMVFYDAFLMPASYVERSFSPEETWGCESDEWSYFTQSRHKYRDKYSLRRYLNSVTFPSTKGEIRFCYTGKGADDKELEKLITEVLQPRCGLNYELVGYLVDNGVGHCLLRKYQES